MSSRRSATRSASWICSTYARLSAPRRRRSSGESASGPAAFGGRGGLEPAQVDAGRNHLGVGNPAHGVVGAHELGAGASAVGELLRALAADVRAEEVVDGLLPGRAQDRELERLRHEREPEVEMEDVSPRQQPGEGPPLNELPLEETL